MQKLCSTSGVLKSGVTIVLHLTLTWDCRNHKVWAQSNGCNRTDSL